MPIEECSFTREFAPWIAMILVATGWLVSHLTANSRESRKEIRAAVDNFRVVCSRLSDAAKEYHTAPNHCPDKARQVKSLLAQLAIVLPYCRSLGVGNEVAQSVFQIRREITLNNFDSASKFKPLSLGDDKLVTISGDIDALILQVERAFTSKYHSGRWWVHT